MKGKKANGLIGRLADFILHGFTFVFQTLYICVLVIFIVEVHLSVLLVSVYLRWVLSIP